MGGKPIEAFEGAGRRFRTYEVREAGKATVEDTSSRPAGPKSIKVLTRRRISNHRHRRK